MSETSLRGLVRSTKQANCRNMPVDIFFPSDTAPAAATEKAKAVCRGCSLSSICLLAALDNNEQGIWSATTYKERMQLKRDVARRRYW